MIEIKPTDISEKKVAEVDNYKNIQPEKGMTFLDGEKYLEVLLKREGKDIKNEEFGGHYTSREARLKCIPTNIDRGKWTGDPGESKFVPSDSNERGVKCKEKLNEYGLDSIKYKNLEPDFSPCSEATITIDNMTENRQDYYDEKGEIQLGNFSQADQKCAQLWNEQKKDNRTDWTEEKVYKWRHSPEHWCSWHERCDTKTMDLVPYDIHSYCTHSGGVSECKARDSLNNGGGFDE